MIEFPNVLCTMLMDKRFCFVLHVSLQGPLKVSDQKSEILFSLTFSALYIASFSCGISFLTLLLKTQALLAEATATDSTKAGKNPSCIWYRKCKKILGRSMISMCNWTIVIIKTWMLLHKQFQYEKRPWGKEVEDSHHPDNTTADLACLFSSITISGLVRTYAFKPMVQPWKPACSR